MLSTFHMFRTDLKSIIFMKFSLYEFQFQVNEINSIKTTLYTGVVEKKYSSLI